MRNTLDKRRSVTFVLKDGIDGDDGMCFRRIYRDDGLVTAPGDYAIRHGMKR